MGRDWLKILGMDISFKEKESVNIVNSKTNFDQLKNNLINEFLEVFSDKLGHYRGEAVKLVLKKEAMPKYIKSIPIPFSLKNKVEKELQRLTDEKVLIPVNSSEWGTPIVPVLKRVVKLESVVISK